jgi:YegS/Rv2252/BmrU family lipid kinase
MLCAYDFPNKPFPQLPKNQYSNSPVFHYSTWGEPPSPAAQQFLFKIYSDIFGSKGIGSVKHSSAKIAFVINPSSSMGATGREWPRIKSLARARLGNFQSYITNGPEDATRLTRHVLKEGTDTVVCVGGDGTLNEVVNGFMGEKDPIRPDSVLGFIPHGTGCDFIRTVRIPKDVNRALDLVVGRHTRPLDLGRLEYIDHLGRPDHTYFHNVTSFGLGGEVVERVNRTTKMFGGFVSFLWATLFSLLIYDKKGINIHVDKGKEREVTCWNIAIANGQYHGGGMQVAPKARVDDGVFEVTVMGNLSLAEVFWHFPKLYNGKLSQVKKVSVLSGRRIEAYSDQRVLLDVDGEQPGQLPVVIEMVPNAVQLIRP